MKDSLLPFATWTPLIAALSLMQTTYAAPSFDCSAAVSRVEKMICADPELSQIDILMEAEYKKVLSMSEAPQIIQKAQRRWIVGRDKCPDRNCIEKSYELRLGELLQEQGCAINLATGECEQNASTTTAKMQYRLPRTADGRLMLRSKNECRSGSNEPDDGTIHFKGQAEAVRIQADCIEAGVYDPCEEAGGRWGDAQCAWANLEVAERRIRISESKLQELNDKHLTEALMASRERWKAERATFCQKRNTAYARDLSARDQEDSTAGADQGEPLGLCYRRLAENRAKELEALVKAAKAPINEPTRRSVLKYLDGSPLDQSN